MVGGRGGLEIRETGNCGLKMLETQQLMAKSNIERGRLQTAGGINFAIMQKCTHHLVHSICNVCGFTLLCITPS